MNSLTELDPARWLPHGPGMVLISHIDHCDDDGLRAVSTHHRGPAHPLADADGAVAALHLLEYAAQAAAIHLGVTRARAEAAGPPAQVQPGVIAFVRELWFGVDGIGADAPPLLIEVQRRAAIPGGVAYAFTARFAAGEMLERERAAASTGAAANSGKAERTPADDELPLARGVFGVVLTPSLPAAPVPAVSNPMPGREVN